MNAQNVSQFLIEKAEERAAKDLAYFVAEARALEGREIRPYSLSGARDGLHELTRSLERLDAMRELYTQAQKEAAEGAE